MDLHVVEERCDVLENRVHVAQMDIDPGGPAFGKEHVVRFEVAVHPAPRQGLASRLRCEPIEALHCTSEDALACRLEAQHIGKTPHTADSQIKKENELVRLKRELDGLVKSENFEKAAEVRDRIRTLEMELNRSPE